MDELTTVRGERDEARRERDEALRELRELRGGPPVMPFRTLATGA